MSAKVSLGSLSGTPTARPKRRPSANSRHWIPVKSIIPLPGPRRDVWPNSNGSEPCALHRVMVPAGYDRQKKVWERRKRS
jgi:hypothetical protein